MGKDRLSLPEKKEEPGRYMFNYVKWLRSGAAWLIVIIFLMNELPFLKESEEHKTHLIQTRLNKNESYFDGPKALKDSGVSQGQNYKAQ